MAKRILLPLLVAFVLAVSAHAGKRDPLNAVETDQLRETKDDPPKRLKLMVKFARARMLALEQLRADPKLGSGDEAHDLIEDFNNIAEELEDNLDMYSRQRADLRKPLKEIIEAYSEWQLKLRTIKQTSTPQDLKKYGFTLETAIETVNTGAEISRELMQKSLQAAEDVKKKK